MVDKPVDIMPGDVQRILGRDAQRSNILAARMIADIIKTTLGPKGMDKMLVSPTNDITITNDGVTILEEMEIEHPAAKMMVEIAKAQESEVGDGTTTAVMLAGKLLENAEKLLDQKIHPTVIAKGYSIAAERSKDILKEISLRVTPEDEEILKKIAMTAMTGKSAEEAKEKLSKVIVEAIKQITESGKVDLENIKIIGVKKDGIENTELVKGIVIEKEKVSHDMPTRIRDARIALIDFPIEIKNPEIETRISVTTPEQLQNFISEEEEIIKGMVEKIKKSGANVLFCQKGVDDFAQYLLSKEKIYVCRRVSRSDLEKISKATGGRIISNLNELTMFELGKAEVVEEVKNGENVFTYIRGCHNPKAVTILVYGGSDHVLEEVKRAIRDGLGDVACVVESGLVVPGGGAVEIEVSKRLREFSQLLTGREQLAVEEFASALEFIPATLAENAGLDPIDILTELKSRHDSGERNAGLNLLTNKIENVFESKIIEPLKIKTQAISSATEVAIMILRIDDIILAKGKEKTEKKNEKDRDEEI
ncbi:MAG: thermosome subunit alpha [Candidatus Pacearchaeota archaeon]